MASVAHNGSGSKTHSSNPVLTTSGDLVGTYYDDGTWSGTASLRASIASGYWNYKWQMSVYCNGYESGKVDMGNTHNSSSNRTKTGSVSFSFGGLAQGSSYTVEIRFYSNYNLAYTATFTTTIPVLWQKPGQTFVTRITNNTGGFTKDSGDKAIDDAWRQVDTTNKSYAGDNITMWWDKNSEGQVGNNANPASFACCDKLINDTSGYGQHAAWDYTEGGGDLYHTWGTSTDPCIAPDHWAGEKIVALMIKYWTDSAGNRQSVRQHSGLYFQPKPTVSSNIALRSQRFYTGTPSCIVWRLNTWTITSNGYGVAMSSSTGSTNMSSTAMDLTLGAYGGETGRSITFGDKAFNGNYSLPATPLDLHTLKTAITGPVKDYNTFVFVNWYNPRTGVADRLGFINSGDIGVSIVSGSVTLPTIDKISAISGDGTTIVLEDKKKLYTNKENVTITWKIENSGNKNGFGYDYRCNEDKSDSSVKSSKATPNGCTMAPVQFNLWTGTYGGIDATGSTFTLRHDGIPTTGSNRSAFVLPYIKDSAGYKIFGENTRDYVISPNYNMILIQKPDIPVLSKWENTLPAIDGVKDEIKWEATSPAKWGNVVDFEYGYKLRYLIGKDKTAAGGYEWYFTNAPTAVNTNFSGKFTEIYDRSTTTSCKASLAATSYYSQTWNAYLDFQSDFSTEKSFAIAVKDPYAATVGTLTTPMSTTLLTEVPYEFQCPQETVNCNTLIQTTKIQIDSNPATTIASPTYTTTTPNSLTGALTLKFGKLSLNTTTLTRGAHKIKVTNEVVSYFDSTTPVTNHVYFGTTTVTSNVLDIEVAELPKAPTLNQPTPAYTKAGVIKDVTFTFSPNDWGCLDTQHNNRHFDYEWIGPDGKMIASSTLSRTSTSKTLQKIIFLSPDHEGVYKFRLRQTTVVGSSAWVEKTFEVQAAEEPADTTFETTPIIALANWNWNLKITPNGNGSYNPYVVNTMTSCNGWFETNKYIDPSGDGNKVRGLRGTFTTTGRNLSSKTYTITYNLTGTGGLGNPNGYSSYTDAFLVNATGISFKKDTTALYTQPSGNINLNSEQSLKSGTFTLTQDNKNAGSFNSSITGNIGGTAISASAKFRTPLIPTTETQARYKVDVVLPKWKDTLIGTESYSVTTSGYIIDINNFHNTSYIGTDIVYDYGDGSEISQSPTHVYTSGIDDPCTVKIYKRAMDGYTIVQPVLGWTNLNNQVSVNKNFTTNLNGYETGEYKMLIQYERNFTVKMVHEDKFYDIVPPEIEIFDRSKIGTVNQNSDIIPFKLDVEIYAGTTLSEVYYSMDYGQTWIKVNNNKTDGAHKYFQLDMNLTWLDEIWIKAHGVNPVDEEWSRGTNLKKLGKNYTIIAYEMPSDYLTWLSWYNREYKLLHDIHDFYHAYEYKHDELLAAMKEGELYINDDGKTTYSSPYIFAYLVDNNGNALCNEIATRSSGSRSHITITQAMLNNKNARLRYGFYGLADDIISPVTIKPTLYQTPGQNLWDYTKVPSSVQGTAIITNNNNGTYTISRATGPAENKIRRWSMSHDGGVDKKVRHINKK